MRLPHLKTPRPIPAIPAPVALQATYLNRRAFLSDATVGSESCTFVVSNVAGYAPATPVQVRIAFSDELLTFDVPGTIARSSPRAGTLVEVSGSGLRAFGRVYAFARGLPMPWGRRASERVEVTMPVEVGPVGGAMVRGTVGDLSRGGARMRVRATRLLAGQAVQFSIRVGLFRRIRGQGTVAWVAGGGDGLSLGIEFKSMEGADRQALRTLLFERRGEP